MSHLVQYAYHVTNCCTAVEPRPNWPYLQTSPTGDMDERYNGVLKYLTPGVVYFSTTLMGGLLPSQTPYGIKNARYWRVIVPLSKFNGYRIILLKIYQTNSGVDQVTLLLVPQEDPVLNLKVDQALKEGKVSELTGNVNDYLYRNEVTKQWQSNSYMFNNQKKTWVNIAVPHIIPLNDNSILWDHVLHYM